MFTVEANKLDNMLWIYHIFAIFTKQTKNIYFLNLILFSLICFVNELYCNSNCGDNIFFYHVIVSRIARTKVISNNLGSNSIVAFA